MIVEDDVFRIEPGMRAEFPIPKEFLEKILDNLPLEETQIIFSMDSLGRIRVQGFAISQE